MWTNSQSKAINAPLSNLLVTAAAGSGKTAVMVERILKRVLDDAKTDIDKILVVTYTNAAASEIKERIQQNIIKRINEDPLNERLKKQLLLIDNAKICTIHSLCLDIIKQYFYKIDLDASFRIGDVLEVERIRSEALESVFEEYYDADDDVFLSLVDAYCAGSKTDSKLLSIVKKVYDFSISVPNPQKWLDMSVNFYKNADFEVHSSLILEKIKSELTFAVNLCIELKNFCENSNEESCVGLIKKDIETVDTLLSSCQSIDSFFETSKKIKFAVFSSSYKRDLSDVVLERVEEVRKEVKSCVKNAASFVTVCESDFTEDCKFISVYVEKICEIVKKFSQKFADVKKEKGMIDFSDFEHFALKILQDDNGKKSEEAFAISKKFDEIYIDEYQDCNPIQDRIFYFISGCDEGRANVFMVGDAKQSIYKFRDADPMLFIDKMNTYTEECDEGGYNKISLSKNFRSRKEILYAANYVFKRIMDPYVGGIEYTDYLEENENEEYKSVPEEFKNVEVAVIDKNNSAMNFTTAFDEDLLGESESEEFENAESEAIYIGKKINELIKSKVLVYDKTLKTKRSVSYRDIVVLMRSTSGKTEIFENIFNQLSIPVFSDSSASYFTSPEISVILSYLKIIVNPIDDINLASVLRSGIFRFTDEDFIKIRLFCRDDFFYYALVSYNDSHNDGVSEKIQNFISVTDELKSMSKYLPTDEFIWKVLEKTDYLTYIGTLDAAEQKKLNLRILINKASQFEATEFKGIYNFIKFVDDIIARNSDTDAAKIVNESDDVVRIMSIHKSKGLEFPIVFLSQCGKKFNLSDENANVLCHKELGIGIKYVNYGERFSYTPIIKNAIKNKIHLETLSEEERILYVALTRPKEKLYITGVVNNAQKIFKNISLMLSVHNENFVLPKKIREEANTYFDWILPALFCHNDLKTIQNQFGKIFNDEDEKSRFSLSVIPKSLCALERTERNTERNFDINKDAVYSDMHGKIYSHLSYRYRDDCKPIFQNVTVSEIKKLYEEKDSGYKFYQNEKMPAPKFYQKSDAAAKGTAFHKALQYIDFNLINDKNDIEKAILDLTDEKIINEDDTKLIDSSLIYNFVSSSLGARIRSGKKIFKETPFKISQSAKDVFPDANSDEKIIVQGAIDLFFADENDNIILVDYKTDKASCEDILKKYSIQLKFYKLALEKMTGKSIFECYIYSFYNNCEIKLEV